MTEEVSGQKDEDRAGRWFGAEKEAKVNGPY